MRGLAVLALDQTHGTIPKTAAADVFGQIGCEQAGFHRALFDLATQIRRHFTQAVDFFLVRIDLGFEKASNRVQQQFTFMICRYVRSDVHDVVSLCAAERRRAIRAETKKAISVMAISTTAAAATVGSVFSRNPFHMRRGSV